jgi:selenide,water dikinase
VGLAAPDDAAVYKLSDELAVVLTVDFFAPHVDDPHSYGAIAAANALSDIYAMGGEVTLALNVAAFPEDMAHETVGEILRGGADKVTEAGGIIAGGHTIIDAEPKYGLCVLGLIHPDRILVKTGAQPGDLLYLTKPLGTGIVTTAAQVDKAKPEHLQAATDSMLRLNRHPSHIAREVEAHALTDVTGYSLLGHSYELAAASEVALRLSAARIPVLPGALDYASRGIITGGASRNRKHLDDKVRFSDEVSEEMQHVLFDPQTSGGLLLAVAADKGKDVEARFAAAELPVWHVGEVIKGEGVRVEP